MLHISDMSKLKDFRSLIGENVRYFRRKAKLSQEELAFRAKLSNDFISRTERGIVNISTGSLFRIAEALNVNPFLFFVSELKRAKELEEREKESL